MPVILLHKLTAAFGFYSFLQVSAANCSHLPGDTSVKDLYSVLYRLSNGNAKLGNNTIP